MKSEQKVILQKADFYGWTPMHDACQNGHLNVCEWLYENGAKEDVSKADNEGWTPMIVACKHGHLSVCKWLNEVGAKSDIYKANHADGLRC